MKALLEILKALYSIKDAIIGKQGEGSGEANNLSWYDLLSIVYPVAPIAVMPSNDDSTFVYLKDISIEQELPFKLEGLWPDGIFLYDKPDLGRFQDEYGSYLTKPDGYKYNVFTDYNDSSNIIEGLQIYDFGRVQYTVEINGITFYTYQSD